MSMFSCPPYSQELSQTRRIDSQRIIEEPPPPYEEVTVPKNVY